MIPQAAFGALWKLSRCEGPAPELRVGPYFEAAYGVCYGVGKLANGTRICFDGLVLPDELHWIDADARCVMHLALDPVSAELAAA